MRLLFLFFSVTILISYSCYSNQTDIFLNETLPSAEKAIEEKIKSLPPLKNAQQFKIEKITQGASDSAIYKVSTNDNSFIARFLDTKRDLKERAWEIHLMKKTAEKGISPKIYYASPDEDLILMQYVEGKNFDKELAKNSLLLEKLASKLKYLHSLPIDKETPKILTLEKHFFVQTNVKEYQELLMSFRKTENEFLKDSNLAITHLDLHPNNLIANTKDIWIIDWQDAGIYGPLFDVARIVVDLQLPPQTENHFLKNYFQRKMTTKEKRNYKNAKKIAYIKIIDSMIHFYIKNSDDKDSIIKKLFTDFKFPFSLEEKKIIENILKSNKEEERNILKNQDYFRLAILYMLKKLAMLENKSEPDPLLQKILSHSKKVKDS